MIILVMEPGGIPSFEATVIVSKGERCESTIKKEKGITKVTQFTLV